MNEGCDDAGRSRIDNAIQRRGKPIERPNDGLNRRVPKTAAVAIKGNSNEFSYADAIKRARADISIEQLGINSRIRRAFNGGIIIEIPGPDNDKKAELLRGRLMDVLGESATITTPVARGDIRVVGFDESVQVEDIVSVVAELGQCERLALKVS